jgi:hypothetical protein
VVKSYFAAAAAQPNLTDGPIVHSVGDGGSSQVKGLAVGDTHWRKERGLSEEDEDGWRGLDSILVMVWLLICWMFVMLL